MAFCTQCGKEKDDSYRGLLCSNCNQELERLKLYFNSKYTWFQGSSRPLELQIENLVEERLFNININLHSADIDLRLQKTIKTLLPAGNKTIKFNPFVPENESGTRSLEITISYQDSSYHNHSLTGEFDLLIFAVKEDNSGRVINIQASGDVRMIDSSINEADKRAGLSYQDEMLLQDRSKADEWEEIDLELIRSDFFLPEKFSSEETPELMLSDLAEPKDRVYLVSGEKLTIGRPGEEIPPIPAVCPGYNPDDPNDLSLRISRNQLELISEEGQIFLKNHASAFSLGTSVGERRLETGEELAISKPFTLNISMVLDLELQPVEIEPLLGIITNEDWVSIAGDGQFTEDISHNYMKRCESGFAAVRIFMQQSQGEERKRRAFSYVHVFEPIGGNGDLLRDPKRTGSESLGRIYSLWGRYFLRVFDHGLNEIRLDGNALDAGEIRQLRPGMVLQIGNAGYKIEKTEWPFDS
jgi:hypothetical protein